ncbi:MAG: amino acid ABC transporter permease [Halobacterium sp.]
MTRLSQRVVRDAVLAAFWTWFAVRLVNDWLGGVLVPQGEPFFPPDPVSSAAASLSEVAAESGPLLGWLSTVAQLLDSVAFAMTFLPALASGAWLTVVLTALGIVLGLFIAVPVAAARVYGRVTGWLALGFVELIRGTPLLAQLFVLYYALPLSRWFAALGFVGTGVVPAQAFWVAVVGFTINSAAYQAEYIRGAIESVDPGQLRAARAVGLSQLEGIRFVVLPQALRYAIPSWTNELVYLVKYSSLASFITVTELYRSARGVAFENFRFLDMFLLAAVVYVLLVVSATTTMEWVRRKVAIPGVGGGGSGRAPTID